MSKYILCPKGWPQAINYNKQDILFGAIKYLPLSLMKMKQKIMNDVVVNKTNIFNYVENTLV